MPIEWTDIARDDLLRLRDYIATDSSHYARQFTERIIATVETLTEHPRIGRRVPEAARDDVRELIFQGYRIIYLVEDNHLRILSVLHGSRNLAGRALKPWEAK